MKSSIAILSALLACGLAYANFQQMDSTADPYTNSNGRRTTDAATATNFGEPYYVDSGFANAVPTPLNNGGWMQVIQCFPETVKTEAYCVVEAMTEKPYTTKFDGNSLAICPHDFYPIFTISPIQLHTQKVFACPLPEPGMPPYNIPTGKTGRPMPAIASDPFPTHFYMYAIVSAGTNTQPGNPPVLTPSTGFNWQISCYPKNNTFLPYNDPDTVCNEKNPNVDQRPFLLEAGSIDATASPSTLPFPIKTTVQCPPNYQAYPQVTIGSPNNYTTNTGTFEILNSFAYCIKNIVTNANNYTINVLYTTTTTRITKDNNSLTIYDPTKDSEGNNYTSKKFYNVQWRLLCYPPGLAAPTVNPNGSCDQNNPPYK